VVRAHQHAAGARKAEPAGPRRGAAANDKNRPGGGTNREALGRSRGGLSTKIHLAADRRCRPLTQILTAGQRGDSPQFIPVLEQLRIGRRGTGRPRTRPGAAMGDKACSPAANRAYLRRRGITAVIRVKEDQKNHRRNRGRAGGRPLAFDPAGTASATPPNAASPNSSSSARSPPGMTSASTSTGAPWTWPRSASGYQTPSHDPSSTVNPMFQPSAVPRTATAAARRRR
jgi:hypothetical protein